MDGSTSDLVAKFCSITDADTSTASRFLAESGNDLEAAVVAFYDSGGVAQNEVREPIAPITNVLVEDSSNGFPSFDSHSGKESKLLYSSESGDSHSLSSGPLTGAFGSLRIDTTEILKENGAEDVCDAQKVSELGLKFRPPLDLLAGPTIAEARIEAIKRGTFLLINIQDNSDFLCHMLNRDFWNDYSVKAFFQDECAMWQGLKGIPEAEVFIRLYHVKSFPCLVLIDPLTQEFKKSFEIIKKGFLIDTDAMLKQIRYYVSSHTDCNYMTDSSKPREQTKSKGVVRESSVDVDGFEFDDDVSDDEDSVSNPPSAKIQKLDEATKDAEKPKETVLKGQVRCSDDSLLIRENGPERKRRCLSDSSDTPPVVLTIRFVFPNSSKYTLEVHDSTLVNDICQELERSCAMELTDFNLVFPLGHGTLDKTLSLKDNGISKNCVIYIRKKG